jgi:nitroreductase
MDIGRIIRNRRSVFTNQFSGERISDDLIWEWLENANWAPNHYHTEPWRFKVFTGDGLIGLFDQLAEQYQASAGDKFNQAKLDKYEMRKSQVSHAIAIVVHHSYRPNLQPIEETAAVATAVQNLWLSVSAYEGVGGYWSTGNLVFQPAFHQFLGLAENEHCIGLFYLGKTKPDGIKPQSKRQPIASKVTWISE